MESGRKPEFLEKTHTTHKLHTEMSHLDSNWSLLHCEEKALTTAPACSPPGNGMTYPETQTEAKKSFDFEKTHVRTNNKPSKTFKKSFSSLSKNTNNNEKTEMYLFKWQDVHFLCFMLKH